MKRIFLEVEVRDGEVVILNQRLAETEEHFKDIKNESVKSSAATEEGAKGVTKQMVFLGKAAKKAGTSMRTAFIATGIGLFITALLLVITYWDDITEAVTGTKQAILDSIEAGEQFQKQIESSLKVLDARQKLFEAEGRSIDGIIEQRKRLLKSELLSSIQTAFQLANLLEIEKAEHRRFNLTQRIGGRGTRRGDTFEGFASKKELEEEAELQERLNKANEQSLLLKAQLISLEGGDGVGGSGSGTTAADTGPQSALTPEQIGILDQATQFQDLLTEAQTIGGNERQALSQEQADAQINIAQYEAEAKLASLEIYSNGLRAISNLIGKETLVGKLAAIASAGVSTFLSAQLAYQSQLTIPSPDAPLRAALAAGVAVAQGLANIKRIIAVKIPGVGGGGGGFSATGGGDFGGGVPQLDFNVVGDTGINQLGNIIGEEFGKERRSYILWQDIKKNQRVEDNSIFESQV